MSTFIEQERQYLDDEIEDQRYQKKSTWRSVFCSKLFKAIIVCIIFAVACPYIAYYVVLGQIHIKEPEKYSCLVQADYRIPCGKVGITSDDCYNIQCCYNYTTQQCHHYLPSKYFYSKQDDGTYQASQKNSTYGTPNLPTLQLDVIQQDQNKLSLVVHDSSQQVSSKDNVANPNYKVSISDKKLEVQVFDRDNDTVLSTASGALIASDYYWEWSFMLSNDTIFGLNRDIIKLGENETMSKVIYKSKRDHDTLPVLWGYKNKKFFGCVVKHDGPLELTVLASNFVILRSLVGKKIELELSLGPTPKELHDQYFQTSVLPPLWTLGTHNCRKGDSTDLSQLIKTYSNNNGTKFDTDCIHENLFLAIQTNTVDNVLKQFKSVLGDMVQTGTKLMLSLPPHVYVNESNALYTTAKELGIFYSLDDNTVYQGKYHGLSVAYPDYSHPSIMDFIKKLYEFISEKIGNENISGFVLNDNWAADESYRKPDRSLFPYFSEELKNSMIETLPWNLKTHDGQSLHMEHHNSYGSRQYQTLNKYYSQNTDLKDIVIVSASKNFGDTEPALADNYETSWVNFKNYLEKMVFSSISGNYMVGLPICGDTSSYNKSLHETLCIRWYLAAATMPYFRVSSGDPFRDPENLNSKFATNSALVAINRRNLFQEYLYTILSKNESIVRPMYFDYYEDTITFSLDGQYTIGKDIIVVHPFTSGRTKLHAYLPKVRGAWYELWGGGVYIPKKKNNYTVEIDTLETDWINFVAQGSVVALTTDNNIDLIIPLDCSKDVFVANGELYKDQNYLTFKATNNNVTISNLPAECGYTVGYIKLYYYEKTEGFKKIFNKNSIDICSESTGNFTIEFKDADTT